VKYKLVLFKSRDAQYLLKAPPTSGENLVHWCFWLWIN
jgi:hypothetical protein